MRILHFRIPDEIVNDDSAMENFARHVPFFDPNLTHWSIEQDTLTLELAESDASDESLKEIFNQISDRIASGYERVESITIRQVEGDGKYRLDPSQSLEDRGEVVAIANGLYGFSGQYAGVMRALDRLFLDSAITDGYDPVMTPGVLPINSLVKNGYIGSFPNQLLAVSPFRHDIGVLEGINSIGKDGNGLIPSGDLEDPNLCLSPTVCYPCFEMLRDRRDLGDGVKLTAFGHCHRHESGTFEGLMRLQEYSMRELVFAGGANFVEDLRIQAMESLFSLMSRYGASSRVVTATDYFFAMGSEAKLAFQSVQAMKYELQMWIPWCDRWLSVASFNNHMDNLVKSYNIGSDDTVSGCVGYGYERLAYGLYSQFGVDLDTWPTALRKDIHMQ